MAKRLRSRFFLAADDLFIRPEIFFSRWRNAKIIVVKTIFLNLGPANGFKKKKEILLGMMDFLFILSTYSISDAA